MTVLPYAFFTHLYGRKPTYQELAVVRRILLGEIDIDRAIFQIKKVIKS